MPTKFFGSFFLERLCPRNSGVFFSQIACAQEIPWSNSNPLCGCLFRSAMSSYIVTGGGDFVRVAMPELLLYLLRDSSVVE